MHRPPFMDIHLQIAKWLSKWIDHINGQLTTCSLIAFTTEN